MTAPRRVRCPYCDGLDVEPFVEVQEGGGERIETTHRCLNPKCGRAFRDRPPVPGFTGSEVVV